MLKYPLKHQLQYMPDSTLLFEKVAHEEWAIFLDSAQPLGQYGRYDIMVARPMLTISILNNQAYISGNDEPVSLIKEDPFSLLKQIMQPYLNQPKTELGKLPFSGGAVGYFGYDLARYLEKLPDTAQNVAHIPEMNIGIYDWALVVDHREQLTYLVSQGLDPHTKAMWKDLCHLFDGSVTAPENKKSSHSPKPPLKLLSAVTSNMDLPHYSQAFDKIKRYIFNGDCYQVNLAQRFSVKAKGDAWLAYKKLREISPAPFMAYLNLPKMQVLSSSPERFLQITDQHVETRPIKGTRPRTENAEQDYANAKELVESVKDQAENLMIVDLLRNDISKNCEVGSVKTNNLFSLQSFANVHHLVSTVTGTLLKGKTAIDLLSGCFPGGSITGAPKLRAMEIIEELEPHRRGLYCGSIGYIGFDGNMDTNIAIRTMVFADNEISFYAGGGIVADSEMTKEYQETWDKASSMLKLIQYFSVTEAESKLNVISANYKDYHVGS